MYRRGVLSLGGIFRVSWGRAGWLGLVLLGLCAARWGVALGGSGEVPFDLPTDRFSGGDSDPVGSEPWWGDEGDEGLSSLLEEGVTGNHDLRAAWARVERARAGVQRATSALVPSITLDGTANLAPTDSLGFMFGGGGFFSSPDAPATYTSTTATVGARWQLDLWGRQILQRRASLLEEAAAAGDMEAQALALASRLANAYYDLVAARERVTIVERQIASNESLLEVTELRFRQGEATGLDVLQQRQQLAATSTFLPAARVQVRLAEQQLAVLVGRDPSSAQFQVVDHLPDLGTAPRVGRPEDLLRNRPDLRAALSRYEAASARVRSARRTFLPTLAVSGQAGNQALYMDEFNDQWYWGVGANVSVPLFTGGAQVAAIREARAAERTAYHALYQAFLRAVQEVETALAQESELRAQLEAFRTQVEAATLALDESRSRYIAGVASYQSVLTATNALQQAELNALQTHRQLLGARIQLHTALGGPWVTALSANDREGTE